MLPLGLPSQPSIIGLDCTVEEVVEWLRGILLGASLPANVITDVNPYHVYPENLPADIWYLFNSMGYKPSDTGYWKVSKKEDKIVTSSTTTGSRITLEYYLGLEPSGIKTDWVMHEYRINHNKICDADKFQDTGALFRVFLNYGDGKIKEVITDDGICSQGSRNRSMDLGPGKPADLHIQGLHEINDCSNGDFLELLDLIDPESSSSSSENSSILTLYSDEYFDPSALLQDLEEHIQDMQPKHTERKCQGAAPLEAKKVVHEAESLGKPSFSGSNGDLIPGIDNIHKNISSSIPCSIPLSTALGFALISSTLTPRSYSSVVFSSLCACVVTTVP